MFVLSLANRNLSSVMLYWLRASFWLACCVCFLLSESRCERWSQTSSSSSPLSTCRGFRDGWQIEEPWTDSGRLGLDIALFTHAPGLVTAAFLQHETFKTWFQAYLSRSERASGRNELQYVMEHHFHTVQDTVGANTNDGVEITRHCGSCKTAYGSDVRILIWFFTWHSLTLIMTYL